MIFFNEKKIQKDFDDFWHRKLTLKVKFWPHFDSLPLIQNTKFDNFLWLFWFSGKNLSNFVSPIRKLHNPYGHSLPQPRCQFWSRWQSGIWSGQRNLLYRSVWRFYKFSVEKKHTLGQEWILSTHYTKAWIPKFCPRSMMPFSR